jgi:hypothetical protein
VPVVSITLSCKFYGLVSIIQDYVGWVFANVRKLLFKKLNIKLQDLCPSEYMKTVTRLLNPNSIAIGDTMNICHYIKDCMNIR